MNETSNGFRVAVVATVYRPLSHADVIVSRWLKPRPADVDWGWPRPRSHIVSMYVEQRADDDMSADISAQHDVPLFDDVASALCLGGDRLDVDAVLLIGEHGDYPTNDIGQLLYPRKELFDRIVEVFRRSGRSVPVFCDKHLSWNFEWASEMVATAQSLGFMLISSSSIPLCRRIPPLDLAGSKRVKQAMAVFYGPDEAYGYHSYEFVQAIIERRRGGETGIAAITVHRGDDVWRWLDDTGTSGALLDAAVAAVGRENPKHVRDGDLRTNCINQKGDGPMAVCLEYVDGMHLAHVSLNGHITNWGLAIRTDSDDPPLATAPAADDDTHFYGHFATMSRVIEDAFIDGRPPFSPARSLMTTGITSFAMQARSRPGTRLPTPDLRIAYDQIDLPDSDRVWIQ